MAQKKHRVLIVDDSAVSRVMMTRGLNAHPGIEVVDAVPSIKLNALQTERLNLDIVVCDIDATRLGAEELARSLSAVKRLPVVAVSALDLTGVNLMGRGVIGFVQKPVLPGDTPTFLKKLSSKIVLGVAESDTGSPRYAALHSGNPPLGVKPSLDDTIIALGASTGGTEATLEVLKQLPADLPPLIIVQHMPTGFTKMYAERLNRTCEMRVVEASDATMVRRGTVYVAPAGVQTRVLQHGSELVISCVAGEKISGHSPSVDVLYASVAELKNKNKVGIILTGMGRDGAREMLTLRKKGGFTIGQDEKSSVVYGMPMEAYAIGAVQMQGDLKKIPDILLNHLRKL
ncbi:MAG: chemotaxis protein CheB [Eubacteriales bacterium]